MTTLTAPSPVQHTASITNLEWISPGDTLSYFSSRENGVPVHAMEAYTVGWGIAPLILNRSNTCLCHITFQRIVLSVSSGYTCW